MDDKTFSEIINLITQTTGIIPRDSHILGIKNFINKRIIQLSAPKSQQTFNYLEYLKHNNNELLCLINNATVNETYFFREELQFKLFKDKLIEEIKILKNYNKFAPVRIWSAAASSGEEIYSLYLLMNSMDIECECTASDINTQVLNICSNGIYKKNSLRSVDGHEFHYLLNDYKRPDGSIEIPKSIRHKILRKQINLAKLQDFPHNQDVIFLRNVFIYFSQETKKNILYKIASESLAPGGYLFLSMNEVPSIDSSILPENLEKKSDGKIFYFQKRLK